MDSSQVTGTNLCFVQSQCTTLQRRECVCLLHTWNCSKMEKFRSSSKSLKMPETRQLPRHQMHATGQSVAPQSAIHQFQDRGHDNLDQVGYTWHQRRRLKEFRIRYLARKFFDLWAKKTFGQVVPSKARCFYDQKILQKTFGEWKEWWTVCRERELSLGADSHYRHSLHNLMFKAWRAYVCQQQGERNKYYVAESHAKKQKLLRTWQHWLVYVDVQRTKHAMHSVALAFRERSCLRISWAVWRRRHYQNCTGRKMSILALQHWAQSLQSRKLGFKGLCQNVMNTRLQQMRKNLAYRQHQVTVLQKFWNCWKSRLEEKEEQQQQALTSVAHAHYRRVLMRQVFDTWLLNACKQQEYRRGEKKAVLHFERQLLRCFWCFWRRRTAALLEEQESLVRARDHYSNLLLLKTFCLWKQNTQERKTERLKEMQALRFHFSKCLQWTWNKWREYVGHQREKWRKLVQADMHYRHTLLSKTLAAWKSYQLNVQCILYQVAEKEKQRTRLLLRQLLCTWRENALALIHEAKAATRADEHYRRAILSKVLLQWSHAASLRVYCRKQKVTAVMEARKRLDIVRLQTLFLHWKELTRECLMLRAQQHRAVQHHQQHLLQKYLVKWKKYHQQCLGKTLLQRQADQLMTHKLCSASFSCWKTRLLQQRWEKQKAVQALWHWSLSLQRKVFDAWLRFAKGQQQKKDLTEKAAGVYHTALLREGVTRVSRYTADMKQLPGQLQAQHQLKAAYNLHQSVYRCAMLWKQKALSKKLNKPCSFLPPLKKQVTSKRPGVSPEARGHSAEEEPRPSKCSHLPFHLVDGDSILSDLSAIRRARLPPRRPDFLLESLESKELLGPAFTRSEAPFQQPAVNKCSAQTGNLMLTPQMEESACKCLSQLGNTTHFYPPLTRAAVPSVPLWTQDVCCAVQRPELRSPSAFMPQVKAGAEMRDQPVSAHKGARSQDSQQDSVEKLRPNLQPHLLSPEDLVGKWSHQTAAEGEEREHGSRELVFQRKLEVELQHIQQQMQYYFSRKQELRSCQQQAQILQKWLERSTQPGDQDGVQAVQEELDQLQVRINTLTKAQLKERHHVQKLVARLRDIQIALDI
ncbi:protein SFI1 homolog isoform X7 [Strix uralensis]|uniref:protein SFI1 homolog isoform X7 n=1 Tax=Strix uralensis TaxID=36305 RepID=UPI003DA710E3